MQFKINVQVVKLLNILKKNRDKHVSDYKKATKKFHAAFMKELEKVKKNAAKEIYATHLNVRIPVSYENEYNSAIAMLKMSASGSIEINQELFNQYVKDEWHWKHDFLENTTSYLKR